MLLVIGSKHSVYPRICEVDAVGIGATKRELRSPVEALALRDAQSRLPSFSVIGATDQRSGCSFPSEVGEP